MKDIWKQLDALDHHARAFGTLSVELRAALSARGITAPPTTGEDFRCRSCQRLFRTERGLALHTQNAHDGPPVPLSPEEEAAT